MRTLLLSCWLSHSVYFDKVVVKETPNCLTADQSLTYLKTEICINWDSTTNNPCYYINDRYYWTHFNIFCLIQCWKTTGSLLQYVIVVSMPLTGFNKLEKLGYIQAVHMYTVCAHIQIKTGRKMLTSTGELNVKENNKINCRQSFSSCG